MDENPECPKKEKQPDSLTHDLAEEQTPFTSANTYGVLHLVCGKDSWLVLIDVIAADEWSAEDQAEELHQIVLDVLYQPAAIERL